MPNEQAPETYLSIIVPLYNEEENVAPMVEEIGRSFDDYAHTWEVLLVDDGSSDGTGKALEAALENRGAAYRVITLQRNFGQTAAMQAGFDHSHGRYIATLDGDLQNDPADIPRLVERLENEDLDLIVGWRKNRQDDFWLRKFPSGIANRLIGRVTGVRLHDYGCSLKVYRRSVVQNMQLYGDMHRFIPAWMSMYTSPARIREEVVNHRPRLMGTSKYGIGRTFKVLIDLLSVFFFIRFLSRPGHFFGRIGLLLGGLGSAMLVYLAILKFILMQDIGSRPMLIIAIMLVLMGVQAFTTGILSELSTRTYYASKQIRSYVLRSEVVGRHAQSKARASVNVRKDSDVA
jgi:glycosyltransferase involved in cell wall biosynthesis